LELEARHKDGHLLWIDNTLSFIRDENGNTAFILGETRDITKRRQAEEELRESEYKYKSLIENIPDIIFTIDLEGKITFVSKRAKEILGYEDAETINKYLFNFIPEEDRQVAVENLQKGMKGGKIKHIQTPVIAKSGEKVFFDCSFTRIFKDGAVVGAQGTAADITERKLAEMAMKKSEERYRSVFENAGLPIVIMENSLLIFMVNERFVEMSGYEKDRIEGLMKFTDFIASGDRDALLECFSRRKGDKPVEYECQIAHRNGKRFDVLIRLGHIPGADQFIASFTDITSRKQAEVALLENQEHLQKENIRLRSSIRERYRFCDIIGKSQVMQEVYEFILQAAATQANVIIYGESGTGKELVAKAIHETSDRNRKGFVTVHCGAIPETLMESEFFGYKKGAFTGANMDKRGYLDEADGGTLFLDEVGEIGLNMQVKLLRAISGGGYTPVGSNTIKNTDVRIIAATNRNLRDQVKRGAMREDFFYRIHILPIYIPPLRARKDDLPLLIDHILQLHDKNQPPLPGNIAEALLNYDWPGNIRELQNVLHRYITLKRLDFAGEPRTIPAGLEGRLSKDGDSIRKGFAVSTFPGGQAHQSKDHDNMQIEVSTPTLKSLERDHIMRALSEHNWHRGRTASALGINRKTLFRKMEKFGIDHS
jgi:PAS domain S-box-containing protein